MFSNSLFNFNKLIYSLTYSGLEYIKKNKLNLKLNNIIIIKLIVKIFSLN